jgi:hypothetical protein
VVESFEKEVSHKRKEGTGRKEGEEREGERKEKMKGARRGKGNIHVVKKKKEGRKGRKCRAKGRMEKGRKEGGEKEGRKGRKCRTKRRNERRKEGKRKAGKEGSVA